MSLTTRTKLDLGFAGALLALLVVGVMSLWSLARFRHDQRELQRTGEILRTREAALFALSQAETSQRGYLLTGQEVFLRPYVPSTRAVHLHLATLDSLVLDPGPRRPLAAFRQTVTRKLAIMDSTVALARRGDMAGAAAVVRRGTGRELMEEARRAADALAAEEERELAAGQEMARRSARAATWTIVMGSLLAFVTVWLARRRIHGDLAARTLAEAALARSARGLRSLYEVTSSGTLEERERVQRVLRLGREHFGLAGAVLARVRGEQYEVVAADPPEFAIASGDVFPLAETYCSIPLGSRSTASVANASASEWRERPCYGRFGMEAYIGGPVYVGGEMYGALCFLDPRPRPGPFRPEDEDLLRVFAQWIGGEIERMRAREALREREERYRGLVETASDLIYTVDRRGLFTYVNPVLVRTTGYSADELLRMRPMQLVRRDRRAGVRAFYATQVRERVPATYFQFPIITREGREIWIGQNHTLLMDGDRVAGAQALARDITRQREVERLKDEFLSIVSHELRTPLTAIRGSLGLLASGKLGALEERGQRMLSIAAQNTDRLVRLINDLLDIEKIESGTATMERRALDAGTLVRDAAEVMGAMASEAGVRLVVEAEPAPVFADPDRLVQVVTNLVSNAIKYSPRESTVRLSVQAREGQAVVRVSDEGRGIPAGRLEAIFERFEQVDSSDARDKGGTGLGLPIARSIVEQHGGRLWAESEWGRGSTFTFTLPMAGSLASAPPPPRPDMRPLVLVCEAEPGGEASRLLEREGYRVATACSADEALRAVEELRPAAILVVATEPAAEGEATVEALRRNERAREIPVVIMGALNGSKTGLDIATIAGWIAGSREAQAGAADNAGAREHFGVLVVEDDDGVASILCEMLRRSGITSIHARSGAEALRLAAEVDFGLLILDLGLPDADGFAVVERLQRDRRLSDVPVLVYTARDLGDADRERLRLGRTEFLTKSRAPLEEVESRALALLGKLITGGSASAETHPDRG
ncbi:MAG TPA: ATP-binding protein [Longimicrobium sp.]|jgi:PAS domain S-box-containing protein